MTSSSPIARVISPPLEEHGRLRQKLTPGEQKVLAFFHAHLPPEWEIHVKPHLNGLRPDFVILNPLVGIGVFEVRDWTLDGTDHFAREMEAGHAELWGEKDGKAVCLERENPFTDVARHKEKIFNLYCPRLPQKSGFAVITGGVIFPFAPTERVRELQAAFLGAEERRTARTYQPVAGRELLEAGDIHAVFPETRRTGSFIMRPEYADDLRGWLVEPAFDKDNRKPLHLDAKQKRLVTERTGTGYRRIKGPAGSGKSVVMAARAAHLISQGKSVLVVTFNKTLWHYLRGLVLRNVTKPGQMDNIVFTHFHDWCKDVCREANLTAAYHELYAEVREVDQGIMTTDLKARRIGQLLGNILDFEVPNLAMKAASSKHAPRYDAILVDEGQDFLPHWWKALQKFRAHKGEMVLVADTTQDVYGKARNWTDAAMKEAGFSGDWARLDVSYRMPRDARKVAQDFARLFIPPELAYLGEDAQGSLDVEPCAMRWVQCSSSDAQSQCLAEILGMMELAGDGGLSGGDITFLCNDVALGRRVCVALDEDNGIETVHTFEADRKEQDRLKMAFFMGDARLKGTTLHSFKGWETRMLVVHIASAWGDQELASVYAALTRLKRSPQGSWLTVVCSAPELEEYGKTWADHRDVSKPKIPRMLPKPGAARQQAVA